MANEMAPKGTVFVCGACGKRSTYRYGFDAKGKGAADAGWDESCMLNSVLCAEASIKTKDGRVVYADPVEPRP